MIRDARIAETGGKNRKIGERYPPFALKILCTQNAGTLLNQRETEKIFALKLHSKR